MCFLLSKGFDFFYTDIVRRVRVGDGVKMIENKVMVGKFVRMFYVFLVRDGKWVG